MAEFDANEGRGYDLLLIDVAPRVYWSVRRLPEWWNSAAIYGPVRHVPTSRIQDIREISDGVVAVMIAQPRDDWKRIAVDAQTNAGFWNRYTTVIELIDVKRRLVIGDGQAAGFPVRILDDSRLATFVEGEDAVPHLDVWTISLPHQGTVRHP
jgi:hypothetical protein